MGKEIKINSSEWCDVVFDGKNKSYGAYRLRQTSSKRHVVAFLVVFAFVVVVALLPTILNFAQTLFPAPTAGIEEAYEFANVNQAPEENLAEEAIKKVNETPPPELKSTIQFTVPKITDEDIADEDQMKSQAEIQDSKIQVSVADIKGKDDDTGVDIATLKVHEEITQTVERKVFVKVEQMPSFPGGEKEMYAFISKNLVYPVMAMEAGIQGRVNVRFVVTPEGDVSEVEVIKGIHPSCDKEAVRVVKMMPKWTPGRQQGRPVYVYYSLPIVFRLD